MCIRDSDMARIYRAHQLCNEGYQIYFDGLVTTVWSAPNYCYRCGNKASILELYSKDNFYFNVFTEAPENKELNNNVTSNSVTNKVISEYFEDEQVEGSSIESDVFSDAYQAKYASTRKVEYFL